jgi:GAG-pre-integrase domain
MGMIIFEVIDSGATNHMTNSTKYLELLNSCTNDQKISVADGSKITIRGKGTIFDQSIPNVLYVPELTVNLLSVQKLAQELNCNIIFYSKKVVFQNKDTGKKISGVEKNGLYVLDTSNYVVFTTKISGSLFHKRLGHPSNNILKKTCNNLDLDLDFNNCDVCRFAKQSRLLFSLSQTKTETFF